MARGEAKDEGIHARLEVPRSEATRLREPGVNAFILGCAAHKWAVSEVLCLGSISSGDFFTTS